MKPRPSSRLRGSVILAALIFILGASLVLAGWAHVLASEIFNAQASESALQRRIGLLNARALAVAYALARLPTGNATNTAAQLNDPWGGSQHWGRMEWNQSSSSNVYRDAVSVLEFNHFGFGGFGGFAFSNTVVFSALGQNTTNTLLFRARPPQSSGFPATFASTASSNSTGLQVVGTALVWSNLTCTATNYQSPNLYTVSTANRTAFPMPPVTASSSWLSGTNFYDGRVGIPPSATTVSRVILMDDANPSVIDGLSYSPATNSVTHPANTVRTVNIHLQDIPNNTSSSQPVIHHKIYAAPQTNIVAVDVNIYGATDASRASWSPVFLTYGRFDPTDSTNLLPLRTVRFYNWTNSRAVLLQVRDKNNYTNSFWPNQWFQMQYDSGANWRLNMNLFHSRVRVMSSGSFGMSGGLWTSRQVELNSGASLVLRPETLIPAPLERIMPRLAWIEVRERQP